MLKIKCWGDLHRRPQCFFGGRTTRNSIREEAMELVMKKDSRRVLREAIMGMLPKNRSRAKIIRNLTLVKKGL
ncbi:MAG: hypothetical protein UY15_C0042G0009 [Parcubacteria group bacterium GW2011_GWA2_47_9]|nr:MAG: hypothetical protein UY15_C0042G0009 [Parcubacteria group bacterium GW2011_GWA2_47_9]